MTTLEGIRLTARRELVERTRDRAFLVSTVITLVILCAIIVVPRLFGVGRTPTFDVGLVGPAAQPLGPALAAQAPAAGVKLRLRQLPDAAAAAAAARSGRVDVAVIDGRLLVKSDLDDRLGLLVQTVSRALRAEQTLAAAGLGPAQVRAALDPPALPVQTLEPADRAARSRRTIATVAVFVLYGQLIGYCFAVAAGVVEEKATRVVEVLLAAVRPVQLLAGKVIGVGLVGLVQLLLIGVVGLLVATATRAISLPASALGTIGWVLAWFLLGYAFYSSLFAVAGAIVSRQEDLQNTAGPLNLVLIGSFLLAFVALGNPDATLARVASYLPPVAPLVLPVRIAAGGVPAWEVAVSLAVMVVSIVLVVRLAARLYAGAVLRTGARVRLGDAWRAASRPAASRA